MILDRSNKVLVCQRGARHRYAVPRLFEEAGMLAALYTDSSSRSFLGRVCGQLVRMGAGSAGAAALASRVPHGVPRRKLFSSDRIKLSAMAGKQVGLENDYRRWGLQEASVVYSMYGEEAPFLEWAKEQGAKVIIDVFVHPGTNRIVAAEECRLFGHAETTHMDDEDTHTRRVFGLADILLCPSEWVADGVRECAPGLSEKVRISPYGSSVKPASAINKPVPGRVLFAGREPLRKGLHILAEAAATVRQQGVGIDVHVAGVSGQDIGWMEQAGQLNCLGSVPMEQMKQEYRQADVFVLSSFSEGQAGVLLEAMASGVPVVATRESGVDFGEGCGITVPVGDPSALATAIESVVSDRALRTRLAEGALRQAAMYSFDEWKQRLVRVVEEVVQ